MKGTLRVVAIVPARGGTDSVPYLNIKRLGDRPLLAHTLEAAKGAACVDRVVCVAECVAMGGNANTCTTTCNMQIPATMEQAAFEAALLTCTQANCV